MTKKRKIVYVMISLLLLVFSTISIVYAASIDDKYNNLEQYKSYMLDSNWVFVNTSVMMNYLANFFFGIAKAIASITDFFLKALYQGDSLNIIVNLLGDTSSTIYNNIFGRYGVLLFVIGGTVAGIRYMMSAHRGVKDMLQLVLLIGICTLWVTNASPIISSANEFSNDVQSTIATSGDKLLGSGEKLDSKDVLREKFFTQAVEQPFLLLNFNELDKEKVNSNSNFSGENGNRIDSLLSKRDKKSEQEYLKKYEFGDTLEYAGDSNQNYYISDESVTHKLTVSFLSVIMNSILMLPFNVIAFFNFIIQIQIVFYILIVPFTLLASYLPFMRMSYVSVFKNLFGLYVIKAMLGLVILFVSLVMNLTRKIMESSNASPVTIYTTSTILLVVSLVAMWKNRKQILATLSAGGVGNIGISTLNGMMKKPRFNGSIFNSGSSGENQDMNKQENKAPEENLDSPQVRERYNYEEVERTPQEIQNKNQSNVSGNSLNNQPVLDEEQRIMNKDVINDSVRTPQTEYNQSLNMTRGNNYNYDNYRTSQSDYVGSSDSLGSSSNDYVETRPLVDDSSLKYSDYTGQYSNINLTQDEYDKYLDKLGNDKERLHSIIDYASESKNNGLYQNQSDSRRLENIVNRAGQTKNFTSINKPVYSAPFPDYLKEQMKNISQTKSSSEREITEEDEQAYNSMLEELNKR